MRSVLDNYTLVLNKAWKAIGHCTVRNALVLMSRDAAKGLCVKNYRAYSWDEWTSDAENPPTVSNYVQTTKEKIPAPDVIILTRFDKIYFRSVRLTKRSLYRRDDYTCQYCHKQFPDDELSMDHVNPRANGGKTSWENCVTACLGCNNKKADRSLKDANLTLPKAPQRPQWNPIIHVRPDLRPESWRAFTQPEWWEEVKK